jgi:LPS-assembly protein
MPTNLVIGGEAPQDDVPWGHDEQAEPACATEPQVRDVLTWELSQKYFFDPTFGGALVPGRRNVFSTTDDLTGIAFLTGPRNLSPLISRLRAQTSNRTEIEWDLDYDFAHHWMNDSTALVNYHIGAVTLGGGDAFMRVAGETLTSNLSAGATPPPALFNQFRVLLGYGYPNKRGISGAANVGFDANLNFLQYAAVQTTYNWDCCGISAEYRRFNLGTVRNENQFRFTFALSNIGAFGNLSRRDRLF